MPVVLVPGCVIINNIICFTWPVLNAEVPIVLIFCTDVAAMMLDCCTEPVSEFSNNSEDYSVDLHYGILEDFQDSHNGTSSRSSVQEQSHSHGKLLQFCVQRCVEKLFPDDGDFTSTWGPVGFDHKNHPLNLIVSVLGITFFLPL